MKGKIGVIPAAGKGSRAFSPKTQKVMIKIRGKPIIQRNIELMRDQLGVKTIYIVTGYLGHQIKRYFGGGSKFGVEICYVKQEEPRGIGDAVLLTNQYIDNKFFVVLGDEFYMRSNHRDMLPLLRKKFNAVCGFRLEEDAKRIMKNYTGELDGSRILSLMEKPKRTTTRYMGCGTYLFDPVIYRYIKKVPPSALRGEVEITDAINNLAKKESRVHAFFLKGDYVNINSVEDLHLARRLVGDV